MCKLMSFTNTKKLSVDTLEKITKSVAKLMSVSERDGFGIMLKREDNSMILRRFLDPRQASLLSQTKSYPFSKLKTSHNESRPLSKSCVVESIVFHGRSSTNHVNLINTHPISKHGIHLCHNGVVEDHGPKYSMITSNDTEHLVERLNEGIQSIEKNISGYYATISYTDNDKIMTIIKDSTARLFFSYSKAIDSLIFASTSDLIELISKEFKLQCESVQEFQDNIVLKLLGNDIISQEAISPRGRSSYADSLSNISLGYDISKTEITRNYEDYTDEESEFLDEVYCYADFSWSFFKGNRSYTLSEFLDLPDEEKLTCNVIRSDGTILSTDSRINGTLFDGSCLRS